jgi:DNA-nicking Smr family endonuclease
MEPEEDDDDIDLFNPFPDGVVTEFTDVLDLHHIPPKYVKTLIEEFLIEAENRGFRFVRIIHGKGISVQREIVRSILGKTSFVHSFSDAPPEAGGWGATVAELRLKQEG